MERLKRALLYFGIGFVPAIAIILHWRGDSGALLFGILLMALPSGYCFIGRHFGHVSFYGSLVGTIGFIVLKLFISAVVGWIVMPIDLIVGIFQTIAEVRYLRSV